MIVAREHSPWCGVDCVPPETKARNPRNPSLFAPQAFLREILRHSHFPVMRLACSPECKHYGCFGEKTNILMISPIHDDHTLTFVRFCDPKKKSQFPNFPNFKKTNAIVFSKIIIELVKLHTT